MNDEWSRIAANAIDRNSSAAFDAFAMAGYEHQRPCVLFKPALSNDGDMWCALLGDNLQEGVAGFGETPAKAMYAFDEAFLKERTPAATRAALARRAAIAKATA